MKKSAILSIVIGILILAGIYYFTRSKPDVAPQVQTEINQPIVVTVNYKKDQSFEPKTYSVTEGQQVVIKATSDVADELHFHGYDLQIDLEPNVEGTISFTADKTGRFEFELEDHKTALGVIEVNPK